MKSSCMEKIKIDELNEGFIRATRSREHSASEVQRNFKHKRRMESFLDLFKKEIN